jgi:hypothetical protein
MVVGVIEMMRKGLTKGSGRIGYYNVIAKDPMVHRQSAMGIKQPQRAVMPTICPMPETTIAQWVRQHYPGLPEREVQNHVANFMREENAAARYDVLRQARKGGKWQFGDKELPSEPNMTKEEARIAKFRRLARNNDIDHVLFEEFMMRAFPDAVGGYEQEWAERFKKGNPMKYMDSHTLQIYKAVVADYEDKYFKKRTNGGKGGKKKLLQGRVLPSYQKFLKQKKRIRNGKDFFMGDRVTQGNWSDKRWAKARKKDNKQIGKNYEKWERFKSKRWM